MKNLYVGNLPHSTTEAELRNIFEAHGAVEKITLVTALPFGRCCMYRPPPLRGAPVLAGKKVLLIDANQPTRDVRVRVLQSHGVEVHAAESLRTARFLWQPDVYDLILLDVRRHLPGEAPEFYEQIRTANPKEHFAFLVGPPVYLSRTWPGEVTVHDVSQGQWQATVGRFLTAA